MRLRFLLSLFLLFWLDASTILRLPALADEERLMREIELEREESWGRCQDSQDIDPRSTWRDPVCLFKSI
jgi:hypothetical protein